MSRDTLYILPNQLFDLNHIPDNINAVVLWEHPHYFTKYRFNKKKLILHRASMRNYYDILISNQFDVCYVPFHKKHKVKKQAVMFDPINVIDDFENIQKLESPNFLVDKCFLQSIYHNKKSKDSMSFTNYFYPRVKEKIALLTDTKSTDQNNRNKFDETIDIPDLPSVHNKYIKEAISYVERYFSKNYGNSDNFIYPISHKDANKWLQDFLKHRLDFFGKYQDAIVEKESFMFHSVLSSSINIGLLNPSDVIHAIKPYLKKTHINNTEAYIRQLIWREFQRYCYIYLKEDLETKNKFTLTTKMSKKWYTGNTGIYPLDMTIQKAFDTAYLHHIERLMIMGNMMLLHKIRKKDGFRWFIEFAIDSYEWVMYQNVFDMVFFSTGGKTTYKPYTSSSKYVLRMSNYQPGEWTKKWDILYKNRS